MLCKCKRHLMMRSEVRQFFFQEPLNIYLQHVLQNFFYFMNIQSQNIYLKNTPAPSPGD